MTISCRTAYIDHEAIREGVAFFALSRPEKKSKACNSWGDTLDVSSPPHLKVCLVMEVLVVRKEPGWEAEDVDLRRQVDA